MKEITVLGIDLAKTVFHLVGMNKHGKVCLKKKIYRDELAEFIANLAPTTVAMEACGSANYWGQKFQSYGHTVKLIAPQFVKPYVKTNKNDMADAEAIAEAATRPTMRFVPLKSRDQQDVQSLHRVRERLIKNRTAIGNQIRGLAAEYGMIFPKSIVQLRSQLAETLEKRRNELSWLCLETFAQLSQELASIEERIAFYEKQIERIAKTNEITILLQTIEGVGAIIATAIYAAIGNGSDFQNGRHLAAWLGIVPRQHSSGGKNVLLGISKRGDVFLRTNLIHGARSALRTSGKKHDKRNVWAEQLKQRVGFKKAAVALANKNARTIWAVLNTREAYKPVFEI